MRITTTLAAAALALLAACASAPPNGAEAMLAGNLQLAEQQAVAAAGRGDPTGYTNLGAIAARRGDRPGSVRWLTIAARMGEPQARANLAAAGEPVPPVDLVPQQAALPGATAAELLSAFADGMAGARPVRCTSAAGATRGSVDTTCR